MFLMLAGFIVGVASIGFATYIKNADMRYALLVQARSIDLALDWSSMYANIQSVSNKNLDTSERRDLKKQTTAVSDLTPYRERMAKICSVYPKCRAVYLMQENAKKQIVFLLDSSPPNSNLYLPPGTIYSEVSARLYKVFTVNNVLTEGPYSDRWGTWVSAFVPHALPNKQIVVVGIDIEAKEWNKALFQSAILPTIATFAFLSVILIYSILWRTKAKQNDRLKKSQIQLLKLSHEDTLTGLPNRRLLESRLEQIIALAERGGDQFTVMYIDLDGFKNVNDTLGHDVGDQLLCLIAERLTYLLRMQDTVARLAGDEFVVLLPRIFNQINAELVAEKIIQELEMPVTIENSIIKVTASIGIVIYSEKLSTPQRLIKAADDAMYLAKKAGANRYYYSTTIPKSSLD